MTKDEYKEEYAKLMMEVLNEKDLEKRKVLNEKLKELQRKYRKSLAEERFKDKDWRVLKW